MPGAVGERTRNPARPPRHGPFATVRWDRRRGEWVRTLTPDGTRLVADHLARYPEPGAVLYKRWPDLARVAFARFPADEVHHVAAVGVVTAAALYDPVRTISFAGYAVPHVRAAVQRHLLRPRRAGEPERFARFGQGHHHDPDHEGAPDPAAAEQPPPLEWTPAEWRAVFRPLRPLQRKAVALVFRCGLSQGEASRVMGVSRSRVYQLVRDAAARLADDLPAPVRDAARGTDVH